MADAAVGCDSWTAVSPEKPRSTATGPRSGRISCTKFDGNPETLPLVGTFRRAGDTSNATALENFGDAARLACVVAENNVVGPNNITNAIAKDNLLVRIFSPPNDVGLPLLAHCGFKHATGLESDRMTARSTLC